MPARATPLLATRLESDTDLLALRRAGREIARTLGLDLHAQVRVATALSEVGRAAIALGPAEVTIDLDRGVGGARLRADVASAAALQDSGLAADGGVPAARRLVDEVSRAVDGRHVTLTVRLGASAQTDAATLDALGRSVTMGYGADALDELRVQNAELLRTHDELLAQKEELRRLNSELEETNRGVLAMYHQLSAELEETNTGVVALYAELDERGRELAAANEAKSRFLRNVSHELRSPVNSIIGLSSLLESSSLAAAQAEQVDFVRESATTLLTLVDELLDLARAEAGHEDVALAPIDVPELFEELRGTTLPLVRDGVDLVVVCAPDVSLVSDRRLVARVLRNLLTNAVKFTERGAVRLDASATDGTVRFTVEDTGLGIGPEHLDAVFEEFVQVPNRLQPTVRGTGLGLPYARRTSEALGGTLTARSEPDVGSSFTVALPSAPPVPVTASAPRPPAPAPATDEARGLDLGHVMVVDDDRAFGGYVAGLLRENAARVSVAHDGQHALALLRDAAADAAVVDVRLPGIDGVQLLERLRAEHPRLTVVLMSSGSAPEQGGIERPAAFLPKSGLTQDVLVRALRAEGQDS
ncbi:ATP-binding protein [Isoptericola sp. NPDC057559]|uniref:sensor histidine kinase n=1 Tax=Isoptericola sp. NPDC057559 TaxID=3346168 RepID=UPI0036CD688D